MCVCVEYCIVAQCLSNTLETNEWKHKRKCVHQLRTPQKFVKNSKYRILSDLFLFTGLQPSATPLYYYSLQGVGEVVSSIVGAGGEVILSASPCWPARPYPLNTRHASPNCPDMTPRASPSLGHVTCHPKVPQALLSSDTQTSPSSAQSSGRRTHLATQVRITLIVLGQLGTQPLILSSLVAFFFHLFI